MAPIGPSERGGLPRTGEQWQEAVDSAEACLAIESARLYGLIQGGPAIDLERCEYLLAEGARRGFKPHGDAIERTVRLSLVKAAD